MSELANGPRPKKRWRAAGIAAGLLGVALLPNQISPTQPTVAEEVFTVGADFTAAVSTVPDLADFTAMPSTAGVLTAVLPVCTAVLAMAAGAAGTMAGMAGATAGG